jgi:capsular polysaccharide biosynthesis protein
LVLGAGSALGREYLDPAVHDARALEDLDIPVLAEIPHIDRAA